MEEPAVAAEVPIVMEEAPVVQPEDMPKISLELLQEVHTAQAAHGLRRNVPDYDRYRE